MNVIKYSIGNTLICLLGDLDYDPYQNQQKNFNINNKIYESICIHLIGDIPSDNYNLLDHINANVSVNSYCFDNYCFDNMMKNKAANMKCGVIYYLHNNWTRRGNVVINNNKEFDLTVLPQGRDGPYFYKYKEN